MMNEIFAAAHGKPEPAGFYDPIDNLTEHALLYRLLIGMENVKKCHPDLPDKINGLPEAVYKYWHSGDHGIIHSRQVRKRVTEIIASCPDLIRYLSHHWIDQKDIEALFNWTSILHDIGRFIDASSGLNHQSLGADLASNCFINEVDINEEMSALLHIMINHHDYICEFIDGNPLPIHFMEFPLAEIFRLADTTSLSPGNEIVRWYDTGRQAGTVFFNPDLTPEQRFDFQASYDNWDQIQYFFLFFAIQPKDWFFGETRDLYRQWSMKTEGGKTQALRKIIELAANEKCNTEKIAAIRDIFDQFFQKFDLPKLIC